MERTKIGLILLFLLFTVSVMASDYKSDIYIAYITGNMDKWKGVIDEMDQVHNKNDAFIIELLNYQYGYIGWCISNNKKEEAGKYLEKAWKNVNILESRKKMLSDVNAYRSALYGFKIGLNNLKAPFAGPKSVACAEKAIRLDSKNPNGYIQYANALYYMPESFGGSKSAAIDNYRVAEELMELKPEEIKDDWNYLGLLVIIGKAYMESGESEKAKLFFEKTLKIEPNFSWVRDELYPELLNEMK
jgi:tetratricopeptide (TPR) repeat protein